MTLAMGEDQAALQRAVGRLLKERCAAAVPRSYLDGAEDGLPPFWEEIGELGWMGIHLPEPTGGGGGSLGDVAVVLEEMGRVLAPGPYLPTVLAGAVIDRLGTPELRSELLPGLAAGTTVGAVAWVDVGRIDDGRLSGRWTLVPGAGLATLLIVPAERGDRVVWSVVDRREVTVTERPSIDPTRRVADVVADAVPATPLAPAEEDWVERVAVRLLAAEAVGAAGWCVDAAAEYATTRRQFGQPIGQFQGVKHRCADMLCGVELARAAAWDAARDDDPSADVAAAALAPEALLRAAEGCIQVLGGVGFTWEHDVHLYLKRALAVRALIGPPSRWRARAVEGAKAGRRRALAVDLPPEAEPHRAEIRAFLDDLSQHDKAEWRVRMADAGYLAPHWPRPWGRGADALEQLVIDDELAQAKVPRARLHIAGWLLPTVIAYGSDEQQQRWIPPALRGEVVWCQLYSEPGAGSDLASLATRAVRADGGWRLTGQKVWTTLAHQSDLGMCLARTDPDAPRHEGITCFVVDMKAPGIDIRPLRELTGNALFNEVFFDDVFVPDADVVGPVGGGWRTARTTLGNERVSVSSGSSFGLGEEALLGVLDPDDAVTADEVGRLLVEAHALGLLGLRQTLRALGGGEAGPEASVRKLLASEHDQKVQELGWTLTGRAGAATDGDAAAWAFGYLANRCLTIAGGTSEIQRNVIAERLLGLPRDVSGA